MAPLWQHHFSSCFICRRCVTLNYDKMLKWKYTQNYINLNWINIALHFRLGSDPSSWGALAHHSPQTIKSSVYFCWWWIISAILIAQKETNNSSNYRLEFAWINLLTEASPRPADLLDRSLIRSDRNRVCPNCDELNAVIEVNPIPPHTRTLHRNRIDWTRLKKTHRRQMLQTSKHRIPRFRNAHMHPFIEEIAQFAFIKRFI